MHNFFFSNCNNTIGSRDYSKGKSFRFWNWENNQNRTFVNDDFYQDFVSKDGNLYACINTTITIPGTTEDWSKVISNMVGERGEPGESAYEIWLNLGNSGTEQDFINYLEDKCALRWEER